MPDQVYRTNDGPVLCIALGLCLRPPAALLAQLNSDHWPLLQTPAHDAPRAIVAPPVGVLPSACTIGADRPLECARQRRIAGDLCSSAAQPRDPYTCGHCLVRPAPRQIIPSTQQAGQGPMTQGRRQVLSLSPFSRTRVRSRACMSRATLSSG